MAKTDTKQRGDLNPKQEKFSQLYATEIEFFGNGVQSYIEAYDPDTSKRNWYKSACVIASKLLSNAKVCARITELLEQDGLNDQHVDKQLLFMITQFDDKSSKLAAIKEYNKLKQRITDKAEVDHKGLTVIVEDVYGNKPNFRPSNQTSKTDEMAKNSSPEQS